MAPKKVDEVKIREALADLDTQEVPNYLQAQKKYGITRTTIMRRY
jgi:hypothetical protein